MACGESPAGQFWNSFGSFCACTGEASAIAVSAIRIELARHFCTVSIGLRLSDPRKLVEQRN
jgi:hypothetical protein